ncbi:Trp biosynthesis-associated membrane protein [Janibacter cremeus]|uniref:Putative membrane protein (TIGR02234 family) n=1 Tax=Janibacter cremeus TaxID=1285192 RepID=A0A852VW12_9MICO|nr:Trp biosynthesis-associated membrane protein [Janibacter cremeus]NYF99580.1 putative membrane protein (TIGR02234 family) [Janibacter cremeus]
MSMLTRKPVVVLLAIAAGIIMLAAGRADWISGTVDGPAGPMQASAVGTDAAPGLAGLALVAMAAAVAATTSGRIARWVSILAMIGVGVGVIALSVRAVLSAPAVLGVVAAEGSGTTGTLEATGSASAWPWVAVIGAVVLLLAAVGAVLGGSRWGALGGKYERPTGDDPTQAGGARGERVDSDWDRVTRGDDPSVD